MCHSVCVIVCLFCWPAGGGCVMTAVLLPAGLENLNNSETGNPENPLDQAPNP